VSALLGPNLDNILREDNNEGQMVAAALAGAYATALKVVQDEEYMLRVIALLVQIVAIEDDFLPSLVKEVIPLLTYLAENFRDELLEAIECEADIGQFIVNQSQLEPCAADAQNILKLLGFQEDS
jgi:hypothetical protein